MSKKMWVSDSSGTPRLIKRVHICQPDGTWLEVPVDKHVEESLRALEAHRAHMARFFVRFYFGLFAILAAAILVTWLAR
jgi:hypothetical protein